MNMIVCEIFVCFYILLTALIVKNSYGISFMFLKECPKPNLKNFQSQIWTSVRKPGK